jgi:flagellar hook protein FlgE
MALTGALYTGVSGLEVNQTWLNVIGNNVANSNTTAFKSSRVEFSPQFYVTDTEGSAPSTDSGGTNPSQEGLGTLLGSVEKNFNAGAIQATGQASDMAIDGSGFFVVKGASQSYTRDGSFTLNSNNQLVTGAGDFVQGYGVDANGNVSQGALQDLTIPLGEKEVAKATQNATMQGNLDASGAVATGASILTSQDLVSISAPTTAPTGASLLTDLASATSPTVPAFSVGQTITLAGTKGGRALSPSTFTVTGTSTASDFETFLTQSMGIDTTVAPPPTTAAPGATMEAGTATDSSHFVLTGNTGTANAIEIPSLSLTSSTGASPVSFADGTDAAGFTSNANGESVHTSFQAYDSLGAPVLVDVTAVLESKASSGNTWRFYANSADNTANGLNLGSGTLTFDNNGNLQSSTGTGITIDRAGTGATTPLSINLNFSGLTELSGQQSTVTVSTQDGFPAGALDSYSVGTDGVITGAFSNGQTRTMGQVAIATFSNPQGLNDIGGNLYQASAGSGNAQIGSPQQFGAGAIRGASLEQSNVDLSTEFTNMIVASTGFSANSKVITTAEQLIQQLLNTAGTA